MRWVEFEGRAPRLARLGESMLGDPGVVLVVTVRADGAPRLSPVEPLFWNGELWLSMGFGTLKARDLGRDARILVQSIVTNRIGTTGEYKLRGMAMEERDERVHEQYAHVVADQLGWEPQPGRFHLFRVDIADVTFIRWDEATNDQVRHALARGWRVRSARDVRHQRGRPRTQARPPRLTQPLDPKPLKAGGRGHEMKAVEGVDS